MSTGPYVANLEKVVRVHVDFRGGEVMRRVAASLILIREPGTEAVDVRSASREGQIPEHVTGLSWKTKLEIRIDTKAASFLEDAASGSLPSVSWVDPAITSFNPLGFCPNDDHAPADIRDGQDLVLAVYDAVAASPAWERSLLVVFYDEHGGFYDHVPPPQAPDDDPAMFGRYGVRVPAIMVSPWVAPRAVSSTVFDHTSMIKSIMLRFCPEALQNPPQTKNRVGKLHAGHPALPGRAGGPRPPSHRVITVLWGIWGRRFE